MAHHAVRLRLGAAARVLVLALAALVSIVPAAAEPVLHEYIDLGDGSGLVEPAITGEHPSRPDVGATAGSGDDSPSDRLTSGASTATSLRIDSNTARPSRVDYEDPFTPTIVPFKRGVAYDGVNREGDLIVVDRRVVALPARPAAGAIDEHFRASFALDLEANEPTPIPSVAPGARLVVAHPEPPAEVSLGVDSAENWFVRSKRSGPLRLTLQLTADRRVFGSEFRDGTWSELARALPPVPENVKSSALDVARTVGVASAARPKIAVHGLVDHFRRFAPSERKPSTQGLALYRDLALTARGICRHRAYAFMITALGLGIPTRYVMNEAHAWVEVFDGAIWHRIDLGGAAEQLSMNETGRPRHVEPRDPFPWQNPNESGHALAQRTQHPEPGSAGPEPESSPTAPDSSLEPPVPSPSAAAPGRPPGAGGADPTLPAEAPALGPLPEPGELVEEQPSLAEVLVQTSAQRAQRGKTLYVAGRVRQQGRGCPGSSVDVRLVTPVGPVPLGALVTNATGEFKGTLVIPWDAPLGEHRLEASAPGACARR